MVIRINQILRRLNHIGTHPVHTDLAISNSIDYLNWIGIKEKKKNEISSKILV